MSENKKIQNDKSSTDSKKTIAGKVVKKNGKTLSVIVERYVKHPKYKKYYTVRSKFLVHDPEEKYNEGDKVEFSSCRPISKRKHFTVIG